MAVRRPNPGTPGSPTPAGEKKLDLMEHLVRKSIEINPMLQTERDLNESVKAIKAQAAGPAQSDVQPRATLSKSERRKQTIAFFFGQKEEEFNDDMAQLIEQKRQLEAQMAQVQATYCSEVVDFLAMMQGGADTPEAQSVLGEFGRFLKALGVSEGEVIARVRGAK